jgi:hypothetical protein
MRTPPLLKDLHPWLRWRVNDIAVSHRISLPDASLCLIWAHRSTDEQKAAYAAKRSKLDGVRKFSLHNYRPSLAADLWVYTGSDDDDPILYEGRPSKREGLSLQLLQRGSLKRYYISLGALAREAGLEAGALWRLFRDGPHVQVPKRQRMMLLQDALNAKGFPAGMADGIIGPKTKAAINKAADEACETGYFRSSLMPVRPSLWEWLHEED